MSTLRRAARTLGYGTAIAAAGLAGVLGAELLAARLRRYARPAIGPGIRATIGEPPAPTVRLVMLGDSLAAGVGVRSVDESVGGHLGALLGDRPDVAVILVGLNDVIGLVSPAQAAYHLGEAVQRLVDARVAVVVGTCPDLAASRALGPPLRQIVGWLGKRIATAQEPAVVEAGGVAVDLARRTSA